MKKYPSIGEKIIDYCGIINRINELQKELPDARDEWYDTEMNFNRCYSNEIKELEELQRKFIFLFEEIHDYPQGY